MAVLRFASRMVALAAGLPLAAAGLIGLGLARAGESAAASTGRDLLIRAVAAAEGALGSELGPDAVTDALLRPPVHLTAAAIGVVLLVFALFPRRGGAALEEDEHKERRRDAPPRLERSARKRAEKQVRDLVRRGRTKEAAELCFTVDLLDRAVELYVQCGDVTRAAEIRHDQNRFEDAAELYTKAGHLETAATIYAELGQPERAAETYLKAGRKSMAAELFEKANQHAKAARCYEESGFARHAAQAYLRAQNWGRAAAQLEEVIVEEGSRAGKEQEVRKLVLQCGKLYEQSGQLDKAAAILERGGCHAAAAELALRLQRHAKAAELFQKCGEVLKAADALRQLGEDRAAAQLLGEWHRDRGNEEDAAAAFEEAGDDLSAGDLYRKLQNPAKAAECYERNHDHALAAEMHRQAGDLARAGQCYETAHRYADAAACWGEAGDATRQAELLVKAEHYFEAGEIFQKVGREDDAIKVLQKIDAAHPDNARASAILGRIFKGKGMLSLSIKKLRHALGDAPLSRENIDAFFQLAVVYDANRQFREAVDLYEKIMACDYHFADVEARLDAGREKLRLAEMKEPAGGGAGASGGSLTPSGSARYQILAELGRGGMGIVYKANDTLLDRVVAYKVLPDALKENPQALKNFLREAKSAAQLNHPHIVTVYDAGEQDGRYYIAMEFVDGTTLKEILKRRGAIAAGGVLHVLSQMCEALAYAHDRKIVHRDVKSANTMWTRDKKAKIMDFGLAKVMEEVRNHTTLVSGTPYYMSPEQTLGKNVDHRTDIYSLGVTIFELATGRLPFVEGNIPYHHVHTPPPDPREIHSEVPEVLAAIVSRCLQKDPDARFASTREILGELRAAKARKT